MKKIIEKISWIPYELLNNYFRMPKNPLNLNLKKIGIPKKIVLHYMPGDQGLSKQIALYGFREPLNYKNYYDFVKKDDDVLDVGANIGLFSILSRKAKKIIAIEPIKECIPVLKKNLASEKILKKTKIINMAVGKEGKLLLEKGKHINLSKVVKKRNKNTQEVISKPLKYFVDKYKINLLRMDIEGYEYYILKEKIPKRINKISIEFHTSLMGKTKAIQLLKNLEKAKFIVYKLIEDLPLRLYPFYCLLKKTGLIKKFTYIKKNLPPSECIPYILKGRSIKYLLLKRQN